MVPTRELSSQVFANIKQISLYCSKDIRCFDVNSVDMNQLEALSKISDSPNILIGTPSRILKVLEARKFSLNSQNFQCLVIDEADLILSFGHGKSVQKIANFLPDIYQSFLMSATMNEEIDELKKLFLRNPVILKLEEGVDDEPAKITQYSITCKENDKFLLLFFILKFKLIKGKCLIFVGSIERCYKLKLFLEQFSIRAGVMNSELPQSSRIHAVQEFNKGLFDNLIATDEPDRSKSTKKHGVKSYKSDKEYGVSRGIDFKNVAAVINLDFPRNNTSYTHRIGRTGRGKQSGISLSFVCEKEEQWFEKVKQNQSEKNASIEPYKFDMKKVEGFRYRCEDALRSVTKASLKDARLKEIKTEILNSEKLKTHFAQNPKDYEAIRHDKPLHAVKTQAHLKHVPSYLSPSGKGMQTDQDKPFAVPFNKSSRSQNKRRMIQKSRKSKRKDPLKSMSMSSLNKKRKTV